MEQKQIKKIVIEIIPHEQQRYSTPGDWIFDEEGNLNIYISDLKDNRYNWLVAEHEINEALICLREGIDEKLVSDFDKAFEELRLKHPDIIGDMEPGNMSSAPYFLAHQLATFIEQHSANIHKVSWKEYENAFEKL